MRAGKARAGLRAPRASEHESMRPPDRGRRRVALNHGYRNSPENRGESAAARVGLVGTVPVRGCAAVTGTALGRVKPRNSTIDSRSHQVEIRLQGGKRGLNQSRVGARLEHVQE